VTDLAVIEQCADFYYPSQVCNVWFDRATKKRRFVEELLDDSNESLHYITRSDTTDHNNNTFGRQNKEKKRRIQSYDGDSEAVMFKNVRWVPCSSYKFHLTIPTNDCPSSSATSPVPSLLSVTPANELNVLLCLQDGCPKTFQGIYRRGTRQRHMRLRHGKVRGQEEKEYSCEAVACNKVYMRQDARLKHYRKRHPELNPSAAVRRQ
jgi:hypothetical protein